MRIKHREVYTGRYFRTGQSYCVVIPPDIRAEMKLEMGSTLLMNFQFGVLWMVKATPGMITNRETVAKIFDTLFPDKVEANAAK
jgi:hypothetical protein